MFKNLWSLKGAIFAFELAFVFCFFIGIFNIFSSGNLSRFDSQHWYYINRGLPLSWAGVSVADTSLELPLIKAPFISIKDSYVEKELNKVINLSRFLPLFSISFILAYCFTFPIAKASDENKSLNIILVPILVVLFFLSLFFYFYWFPII